MYYPFVQNFAEEWVAAWNSHNIDRILAHYADDFEMTSPMITKTINEPSGTLQGIAAVRNYWALALKQNPDLHFELINVNRGVNSLIVQYRGHRGMSAEYFYFDEDGKVTSASAHYESL
jgi:hypothetical protein